jgi:hypothetical protein
LNFICSPIFNVKIEPLTRILSFPAFSLQKTFSPPSYCSIPISNNMLHIFPAPSYILIEFPKSIIILLKSEENIADGTPKSHVEQ